MLDDPGMQVVQESSASREKWLAVGAVVVLMALVLRGAWVTEDAYITLRTVDNWVHGHGLRWNLDERVQAYTHPLWMLLLTVPYALSLDAYSSALCLSLSITLLAILALLRTARSGGHALVAVALLLCSRSFLDYSTSGLENPLSHLLIAALVYLYVVREAGTLAIAACAALLALNRTDTLLVALPPLAHTALIALRERGLKSTLRELLLGFSPLGAWLAFSLFYYGFLVPNTAFAKLNTGLPRGELARQGLAYLLNCIAWDPALLIVLALGLASALLLPTRRRQLLALSMLLYLAYVVQIGGDFMLGRFLTVPVFIAACLAATTPLRLSEPAAIAAVLAPLALFLLQPSTSQFERGKAGVEDERKFYESGLPLMMFTRTTPLPHHLLRDVGEEMARNAAIAPVRDSYNIGIMGYYAGRDVHMVDTNALADPLLARLPARFDPNWRIGHYTRHVPEGYLASIAAGKCQMPDANLCAYYDILKQIISGDLWSWSRFKHIAVMNLGGYEYLIDRDRYRYPSLVQDRLLNVSAPIPDGAVWDQPPARTLTVDGIELTLDAPSHAKKLAIAFDANDSYRVLFKSGGTVVAELDSAPHGQALMRTRWLSVPREARRTGFDRLLIRPLAGDGMYSFGYVRLID